MNLLSLQNPEISNKSSEMLYDIVGKSELSRSELAALLARCLEQPDFLPVSVFRALLVIANQSTTAPVPSSPPNHERLIEVLNSTWMDELGVRAARYSESYESVRFAPKQDIQAAGEQVLKAFGPLYEKLAK